jgi:predicted O-methyltransferase YrrM
MASVGAVVQELLLRPRWAWHRWRGEREHVLHGRNAAQRARMAEYEPRALPLDEAIARITGATVAASRRAVEAAPRPSGGAHKAIPPWHDGTVELAATVYALARLRHPRTVVETGVARGVTSAAILQALAENGAGRLHSLDLPGLGAGYREQVGAAVPAALRERWDLHFGPSAVKLGGILRAAAPVDLFIHDSAHTYRNMRWEFEQAARHLAPGGIIVSDDVCNDALLDFVDEHGWELVTVRQSKPAPWTYIGLAKPR